MNAIFYVLRGGIAWRLLPSDLPPKSTVFRWFSLWRDTGLFETINHLLVMAGRERVGRLIDGYADGVIDRVEFEPRVADLRARITQLEEHRTALAAASEARRDLTLVIGRLEDFSMSVRENLDLLDWSARRDIIRLMVRRIEIDEGQVEIVFRIPPLPSGGTGGDRTFKSKHHCTGERRAHLRVADPQPAPG